MSLVRARCRSLVAVIALSVPCSVTAASAATTTTRQAVKLEPKAIVAWCREEMANYKAPRFVEIVDSFPMNATGKVLKFELRDRAATLHPTA